MFFGCKSLKSATIPESVHGFESQLYLCDLEQYFTICLANPFMDCPDLKEWRLSPTDQYLTSEGIALLSKDGCVLIACPAASGEYRVPEGVTEIRAHAFSGCKALTSVILPEGVTKIGFRAFMDCRSLNSIVIPKGLTSIAEAAFKGCESLTSIEIPYGVEEIDPETFKGCSSLTSVEIPYGVTIIDQEAFKGCTSLKTIEIPASVTEIKLWAFKDCPNLTIHAPAGSEAERYAKEKEIPFKAN